MPIQPPVLKKPIPAQVVNEGSLLPAIDLNEYIESPTPESGPLTFLAQLSSRQSLPEGFLATPDGLITGIPQKNTQGTYTVIILAENNSGLPFSTEFTLTVNPGMVIDETKGSAWWNDLKSRVWDAVGKELPIPDFVNELANRPITAVEIYYLLQRYATLTIWDAYNLEVPGEKKPLQLDNASSHYIISDRGSCIVGYPRDLYSHDRTLDDALKTGRAMAGEVYKRGWTIQLAGFEKMARAAWVELQHLGDKNSKPLEILHYSPSAEDQRIYTAQAKIKRTLSS